MIDQATRNALFIEIHKSVAEASSWVLETCGKEDPWYPPGEHLLPEERDALANLQLSAHAKSGLRKLIASACILPVCNLFCLLDGVADPETGDFNPWLGLTLAPASEDEHEDEGLMLHDELYDSYWLYKERMEACT